MKKETIAKNWPSLGFCAGLLENETRRTVLDLLSNLFENGFCRPIYSTGRGRYTHFYNLKADVVEWAKNIGYETVIANDAPRHGLTGDLVILRGDSERCRVSCTVDGDDKFYHLCSQEFTTNKIKVSCYGEDHPMIIYFDSCDKILNSKGV